MHAAPAAAVSTDESAEGRTFSTAADTYDYVIVGGGAAGCVLANRLSEDRSKRVLLLEAGKADAAGLYGRIPIGFPYLLGSSSDWAYMTEPEPALGDRRLYFPRGKCLGGSHAISVMLYHRGDANDYDNTWPSTWSSEDVLPYFIKSETQRSQTIRGKQDSDRTHGFKGPLSVSDLATPNPMTSAFLDAAEAVGLPRNPDFNDWSHAQDGVGAFQVTQQDGTRVTPASAYLDPVRRRRNLTVLTDVIVERLHITPGGSSGPVATGLSYIDKDSKRRTVAARNEIVLAAGVYATPQLLMVSGVGPGDHLSSHGIPVVADRQSVGQNLQDHAAVMHSYLSRDPMADKKRTDIFYTEASGKRLPTLLNYFFRGKGMLTTPMCEAGGFVKTDASYDSCDLQLRFIPFFSEPDPYLSLSDFAQGGTYIANKSNRPAGFTIQSVVARPRSRGFLKLRSPDVRDRVAIHANWMSHPEDMETLVSGLKLTREIASQAQFTDYRGKEGYPGADKVSDDELRQYIRDTCHTANAMVGTCSMGDSEESVVDPELRVRGIANLRIADSSVMPTLPGGQCGAPTMMIAERAADFIKAEASAASK